MPQVVRIEDWTWFNGMLAGAVYGHPNFPDGHRIVTSRLLKLDLQEGMATTLNTTYRLGEPMPSAEIYAQAVEE